MEPAEYEMFPKRVRLLLTGLLATALGCSSATLSPLAARGYTVLPMPQKITLGVNDFEFNRQWRLELGPNLDAGDVSVQSLTEQLQERFHLTLSAGKIEGGLVRLAIVPHSVVAASATDADKNAIDEQAYRLEITRDRISVTGNTAVGLFYGVQTVIQLLKLQHGTLWLPECEIEDWPDLELRAIYWDDAHHLEHLDVLKAALRQASFYKINGFAIKLEGHFEYKHAEPIVEPYALTPAQVQELTDYGLKYHVELILYLDAPSHVAFILKHPEYADMREYPDSNYEFCVTNPKTYELFQGMFEDLLPANKGGKYFILSTDEPYYIGLADNNQCTKPSGRNSLAVWVNYLVNLSLRHRHICMTAAAR